MRVRKRIEIFVSLEPHCLDRQSCMSPRWTLRKKMVDTWRRTRGMSLHSESEARTEIQAQSSENELLTISLRGLVKLICTWSAPSCILLSRKR
jgi:hypothetical protein